MHAPEVVADLVLTEGEEVFTAMGGERGTGGLHGRVEAAHRRESCKLLYAGIHRESVGVPGESPPLAETEWIGDRNLRRTDREDAARAAMHFVSGNDGS